jgi:hypothetical protein
VVVNRIACGDARDQKENLDRNFGKKWQANLYGGKAPQKAPEDVYGAYKAGRSEYESSLPKNVKSTKVLKKPKQVTSSNQLPP